MAFRSRIHATTGIAFQRVGAAPLEPIDHHVSDPMPQRGIAYQPRVPTLGLHPEKQTRVLKERRIAACLGRRPGAPYAVFLQNTPFLLDAVPRVGTLGWYALPRWGKSNDDVFDPVSMPPTGISFHWAGMRCPVQGKTVRSSVVWMAARPNRRKWRGVWRGVWRGGRRRRERGRKWGRSTMRKASEGE